MWKWGGSEWTLPTLTGAEIPPECSVRDIKGSSLSTSSTLWASVTFKTPQTYIRLSRNLLPVPPLMSVNLWPFTKPFQQSALPLGHETVCADELIFPGYRQNTVRSFIKGTFSLSFSHWDVKHQGLHHQALCSWLDVSVLGLNHRSFNREARNFLNIWAVNRTMYDKCQAFSFCQSVQLGICDHAGQFCSTHFTYSMSPTFSVMHFKAFLKYSWQQLIANFNQVVSCGCYGLWHEHNTVHEHTDHHLFKPKVPVEQHDTMHTGPKGLFPISWHCERSS